MPPLKQPRPLLNICLKSVALNIDEILKHQDMRAPHSGKKEFQNLTQPLHQRVLDKILVVGKLHDDNYRKLLSEKTQNLLLRRESCKITKPVEFLEFLHAHCKNVVNIDLEPLLSSGCGGLSTEELSILVGNTLSSMVNLEYIHLRNCDVDDECIKLIGAHCSKLKYLNVQECDDVSDDGIRALCDPNMDQYGKCSQLTHVFLKKDEYRDINWEEIVPKFASLLLLHCPNLEVLDYECTAMALAEAISAVDKSIKIKWWQDEDSESDDDPSASLYDQASAVSLNDPIPSQERIFQLKSLECSLWSNIARPFFRAVAKFCPLLENLTLRPYVFKTPDVGLNELSSLPIKSITVQGNRRSRDSLTLEILLLIRSVGNSLTNLKLVGQSLFDFRVIRRECPNLETLNLVNCGTMQANATWPNYPTKELKTALFRSLKHLTLQMTSISPENRVGLLLSPNLESIEFKDYPNGNVFPPVVKAILDRYPAGFIKLRKLVFEVIEMDKFTLDWLLSRAVRVTDVSVVGCYSEQNGRFAVLDEDEYFLSSQD